MVIVQDSAEMLHITSMDQQRLYRLIYNVNLILYFILNCIHLVNVFNYVTINITNMYIQETQIPYRY